MKKFFENLTGGYSASARVVDGSLVISLPNAMSPVVWRMDLENVKSSALEIKEKDGGTHVLVLRSPKGETQDIAPFSTRIQAVKSLMTISRALENGGEPQKFSGKAAAKKEDKEGFARWGSAMAALLILVVLVVFFIGQTPQTGTIPAGASGETTTATNPASQTGVPVSADDFLMSR